MYVLANMKICYKVFGAFLSVAKTTQTPLLFYPPNWERRHLSIPLFDLDLNDEKLAREKHLTDKVIEGATMSESE